MRLAGLLLALCGCNQLLELHDVESGDQDADRDGVRDRLDNCKGTANPSQADSDGDAIGDDCDQLSCDIPGLSINRDADLDGVDDGCDTCLRGGPEDEDGDAIADRCDVCPASADPAQTDTDGDYIGDACDSFKGASNERAVFDGFNGTSAWLPKSWTVQSGTASSDGLRTTIPINDGALDGLVWSAEMTVELPAAGIDGEQIGFELQDERQDTALCGLAYDGASGLYLPLVVGGVGPLFTGRPRMVSPGATTRIVLRAVDKSEWACQIDDANPGVFPTSVVPYKLRLTASSALAKVRYVDVIR